MSRQQGELYLSLTVTLNLTLHLTLTLTLTDPDPDPDRDPISIPNLTRAGACGSPKKRGFLDDIGEDGNDMSNILGVIQVGLINAGYT